MWSLMLWATFVSQWTGYPYSATACEMPMIEPGETTTRLCQDHPSHCHHIEGAIVLTECGPTYQVQGQKIQQEAPNT